MTIAAEGPQKYGAIFAGLRLDPASQRLTVYVTSHDNAAETDMRQNLPAGSVDFTIVPRSQAQLLGFHDRINADWVRLQETGHLVISSAGPDPATGREQIGVVDLTAAKAVYLDAQLGADNIELQTASVADLPHAVSLCNGTTANRINDCPGWNGGDFISNGTENCTSGLPVHNSAGQQFIVTAGHCSPTNAAVWNWAPYIGLGSATQQTLIGHVYSNAIGPKCAALPCQVGLDAEIIPAASSSLAWNGGTSTSTTLNFAGQSGMPYDGLAVCPDGAFEGQHCTETVKGPIPATRSYCANNICTAYYTSRDTVEMDGTDGQAVGPGDSGGPVYAGTIAVGIITAAVASGDCGNWGSQAAAQGNPTRQCGHDAFFTGAAWVLSEWGLAVNG
jgi:hypothetical protein